jgi:hypothetical protein
MKQLTRSIFVTVGVLVPVALLAQAAATPPAYNVLTVYRETVKPGKSDAHDAHEVGWAGELAAAKNPNNMLAVTAMTGSPENWYISAFPTWADYEKANKASNATPALQAINKRYAAMEGDYLTDGRMMILTAMPDLSYGGPADIASSRYFSVTRITVRPGHTAEYEDIRKLIKAAHETAKLKDSYSIWRAAAGAPAGTYFQFVARKTLGEIDESTAMHGAAYTAALGGAEGQKKLDAMAAAAVVSSQADHFAFAPQQSIPPAEWVTSDPAYWTHKPIIKKIL